MYRSFWRGHLIERTGCPYIPRLGHVQVGHQPVKPGKPGKVREFVSGHWSGKVRENRPMFLSLVCQLGYNTFQLLLSCLHDSMYPNFGAQIGDFVPK